ncbi:redoxin domain-containing protein [Pedobacter sp. BS3]|uniref:redoxin domain-containing protein n=1 Tax=Pedobacter sp. BS3 TaxID=2567937 RepID=UPI0011EF386C|nr:redoxin domain-containing protein [Pedobacter sp. BS3]TZF82208.1 redoxin domain-containing protein [Pedobacter sp. BS3]
MLSFIHKFTDYIFSDITDTRIYEEVKRIEPVRAGEFIPDFNLQREKGKWEATQFRSHNGFITLKNLLNKPLVVVFYSAYWNKYGNELLKTISSLQDNIKLFGGNLLIVSAENIKYTDRFNGLNVYYDENNALAGKFGLYTEDDPIWNRFSGIDVNIPLLSVYVIAPSRQVVYDYVEGASDDFSSTDLLTAVHGASLYNRS